MPLDAPAGDALAHRVARLNVQTRHHAAQDVMRRAVETLPRLALVSSFGAESVALLHLAAQVAPDLPILFIDTEMLFEETLVYQHTLAEKLGLTRAIVVKASDIVAEDPDGRLHERDPDACCALRKTRPLQLALARYDGWITGRKRFQTDGRATLPHFEAEEGSNRVKINPLAFWSARDVQDYIEENNLPRHPLVSRGFPSIGCMPCTSPVAPGEAPRAGRWRNSSKDECGIHFANGKAIRQGA